MHSNKAAGLFALGCGVGLAVGLLAWKTMGCKPCKTVKGHGAEKAEESAKKASCSGSSPGGTTTLPTSTPAPAAMVMDFKGRRVIVTGAARGIGRAIAAQLLSCGAEVVGVDVLEDVLTATSRDLGDKFTPLVVNLLSDDEIQKAVTSMGDVDFLVNTAGVAVFEPYFETSRKAYDLQFGVNVRGLMELSQRFAEKLKERIDGGEKVSNAAIVNISSQSSTIALADHLVYSTTKAAVDHITRISSLELAPYGIRVNAVNPTVVRTQLAVDNWGEAKLADMATKIPLQRIAEPVDVARAVVFLLSEHASMITGVTLRVDGGFVVAR